jgi:flagellar hook-associated protein 2
MAMRISGLATGMDIDKLVSQLMTAHKMPLDKLQQKSQTYLWQRDAFKEVNTKLTDYRSNKIFDLRLEREWKTTAAIVSGNTTAVTATAGTSVASGTLVIETSALAEAASNYGTAAFGTAAFDPTKTLKTESDAGHITGGALSGVQKIRINGTTIEINPEVDTMNTIISKINRDTNVSSFYDSSTRKISFVSKETGSVNGSIDGLKIQFDDMSGHFLSQFATVATGGANEKAAVDAQVKINGLVTTRKSNSFTINGIDIKLNTTNVGSPSTINTKSDTASITEKIKTFVKDYNEMLATLQNKVGETKYRDFPPLSDEQRSAMSEKDIESWETKAKSGMLRNDSIISEAISKMRTAISSQVDTGSDVYKTLSSIGIQTGSYNENGKLYLDEDKLNKALAADPDAVIAMFTATGTNGKYQGVAENLYNELDDTLDQIKSKAGQFNSFNDNSFISKQITNLDTEITRQNNRMVDLESAYYRRFTAMETAINKFNSQSAYLSQAFGGGTSQ